MLKSGVGTAFTTSVTVVECVRLPLVPVMVIVYVPVGVVELVETDRVELPEPATEVGLKFAVAPLGNPLTLKFTDPVKPFTALTVDVYEAPAPAVTVCELGEDEIPKSAPPPVVVTFTFP